MAEEWAIAETPKEPEPDFYCPTSDVFTARLERLARELDADPVRRKSAPLVSSSVGEIGNNSFDHNLGNWPDVRGVFFAYDTGKHSIVLADRGVGVRATLRRIRPDLETDEDALKAAFTEFITGRAPEHRGNGLKFVKDALMECKASLRFQSGHAILGIRKGHPKLMIKRAGAFIRGSLCFINY